MITTYRRKPDTIQAIFFTRDNFNDVVEFTNGAASNMETPRCPNGISTCLISNTVGTMGKVEYLVLSENEYLIKDNYGVYRKMSKRDFENMYEPTFNAY